MPGQPRTGPPGQHAPGMPGQPVTGAPGGPETGDPGQPPAGGPDQPGPDSGRPGHPADRIMPEAAGYRPGDEAGWPAEWERWEAAAAPGSQADHPVLVGYDGSEPSRHALAYAAGMARRLGRSLLVAYVTSPGVFCEPLTGQVIAALRDSTETQQWLLAELDEVCDRTDLNVAIVTRQGRPARELAAAAAEFSADALVIGAPSALWHHVAGSVPGWLARHAHCPVIVVP